MACSVAALCVFGTPATAQSTNQAASKYDFVDCRLPGVVKRLGRYNTRLQRGQLVRATARTCEIRGGQYVLEDRGSFEGSLEVWLAEAQLGDPKAQTYVGELYERGPNGHPDFELARIWYGRAAKQNFAPAQFSLARFYEEGLGGPIDKEKAAELYYDAMGAEDSLKRVLKLVDAEEVERLNRTIGQRDSTIEAQRRTIDQLNKNITTLRRERDNAQVRILVLERSLSSTRSQLASSMSSQAATVRDLESRIAALDAERRDLSVRESQLRQSEQELSRQQAQLSATLKSHTMPTVSLNEYARLQSDLEAAQSRIATLSSQRDRALRAEEAALRNLSNSDAQFAKKLEELSRRESLLAEREADLARTTNASNLERTTLENERSVLRRERDALTSESQSFSSQINALQAAKREIDRANAELERQRSKLDNRAKILQTMEAVAASVREQQQALQQKFAAVERQTNELKLYRRNYESKFKELVAREAELERKENDVRDQSASLSGNEDQLEDLTARLIDAEARAEQAEQGLADAREALDNIMNGATRGSTASRGNSLTSRKDILKSVDFGRYHAILIGNANYQNEGWDDLVTPHRDVDVIGNILKERYGFKTTILKDATVLEMQDAIVEIDDKMGPRDNLLIYFAGHGQMVKEVGHGYWEPIDSVPNKTNRSIAAAWITETMQLSSARKVLVIADSCYFWNAHKKPSLHSASRCGR